MQCCLHVLQLWHVFLANLCDIRKLFKFHHCPFLRKKSLIEFNLQGGPSKQTIFEGQPCLNKNVCYQLSADWHKRSRIISLNERFCEHTLLCVDFVWMLCASNIFLSPDESSRLNSIEIV